MIVQELHHIQERCGYLPADELRALAKRINVPLRRLHEVASYYPHYKLEPPPVVDVRVCRDMACHIKGGPRLRDALVGLSNELGPRDVVVGGASCLGQCDHPCAVQINDHVYWGKTDDEIKSLVRSAAAKESIKHQKAVDPPTVEWLIEPYRGKPRYGFLRAFAEKPDVDGLLKNLETARLRGMGGAGFPTHLKWKAVRKEASDVKYIVCNADESEPGTFKDRDIMRRTPHLLIEGMILAGLVTGAKQGYLYIRHEYHEERIVLEKAIEVAYQEGLCGDNVLGTGKTFHLEVYVSPGGYVQGEETALLEAIEDRRGEPRNKPPFPTVAGLFGKPTVINNVETLAWVPAIAVHGGEWYAKQGINGATGMRFVSISGDVQKPGVYEVPFGQTVRDLVFYTAGGMSGGQKLKAIATSGPSGGFLPGDLRLKPDDFAAKYRTDRLPADFKGMDLLDLLLDNDSLSAIGNMLGAAFVVYGDRCNMLEEALNCVEFYRNESCGKCVPCRMGSQKLVDIIGLMLGGKYARTNLPLIDELSRTMTITSICGLGQVASNPIATALKHFPADVKKFVP